MYFRICSAIIEQLMSDLAEIKIIVQRFDGRNEFLGVASDCLS